ncbi:IclR family transcriptional regulator [Martelella soudanensis]|uniref:IclR family transcriptional regulator n=1 Tax=unclassified Martelella TaxID=2629616 RepID=UPI0015DD948F|nr:MULTISPECIES: IclR family transcriptional regulator [unclassified Martelella]
MNEADISGDRQFVTSLARGLQVITAFRPEDRALSNQQLADRTGLPRPTVARFTHTLRKLGYLAHHARSGCHSLTPRVAELSQTAFAGAGLLALARPAMEALSELGPVSVALGVPSGKGIRYLDMVRRPEAIVLNLEVGALVPVMQTAIGRAWLSSLSEARRAEALKAIAAADPALCAAQAPQLEREVERYREKGFAVSCGGWWPELNAVATTIRAVDDGDPLLLSISGLSSVVTPERLEAEYAVALMSSARMLQSQMRRLYPD